MRNQHQKNNISYMRYSRASGAQVLSAEYGTQRRGPLALLHSSEQRGPLLYGRRWRRGGQNTAYGLGEGIRHISASLL